MLAGSNVWCRGDEPAAGKARLCAHPQAHAAGGGHPCALRLDVGALVNELVDEAELAMSRRQGENGRATLRSGQAAARRIR